MYELSALAIYLLRNYVGNLPKEILESARMDGASHLQTFMKIIVPLSVPALASFGIFQFLWVWNDLLVALYLGPDGETDRVLPRIIQSQLGTFKSQLHLLNASAVISMIVPKYLRKGSIVSRFSSSSMCWMITLS